ncbi:hypothetical protein DYL59_00440 [Pseudomonas kairouanensis]|uniref:Dermonecrotic toxin N-terminal domain-containing protein n=2 Tax=Pseudomonas kairouanensis TaxID=2293832 RepID=A0A4Z0B190_9PSED|nr:hypothetical protein DYL59_00440 [Pseudomonas kairouanensis]
MHEQGIQMDAASIIPSTGVLTFGEGDNKKTFTLTDNSGWGQIAGPILAAANVISPIKGQRLRVDMNGDEVVVRPKLVTDFYGESLPASKTEARVQIRRLEHNAHAFQPISADDPLRPASSRSAEALQTQTLNAARFYLSAPQALAYKHLAVDVAENLPNTRAEAKKWADAILFKLTGKHIDSDTVYLNRFNGGGHTPEPENATITGWEYTVWEPVSAELLPDALLKNFSEGDWLPGNLDAASGLYTDGFGQSKKNGWGAHNQVPILPSQIMHESWKTDFQGEMTKKIDSFWNTHTEQYQAAIKGEFTYRARKQLKTLEAMPPAERALQAPEHRFGREDYRLVMGAVSNLPLDENAPLTLEQLKAQAPAKGHVQVSPLNIAGFASTDILRFNAADGSRQVLYIPGTEPAFLRFDSLEKLEQWVVDQTKDDKKRAALASHFPLTLRQDHEAGTLEKVAKVLMPVLWFTDVGTGKDGLDTTLQKLASGKLHPAIHDNQSPIEGDVFSAMTTATQHRMTSDADVAIKSNSEVTRDTWLNDITVAAGLLAKLAPIAAPVAAAAVLAGVTELALGAEKQASGDTVAERRDGASKAFDGLLNTLFSLGASATPEDPFAPPPEKPVMPRNQPEISINEEPQPGPSSGIRTPPSTVPTPAPKPTPLLHMAQYAVPDGEQLIKNATRDPLGVYRIKANAGADRHFVRFTDETGKSGIFELYSRYRSGEPFARIVNPDTGSGVMPVRPQPDGEWVHAPMMGGIKWPWRRPSSPPPSDELKQQPKISDGFEVLGAPKTSGADQFDTIFKYDGNTAYEQSVSNFEEGGVLKRKLTVSWTVEENNFEVYPSETAQPNDHGSTAYSPNFLKDLNRDRYTVRIKQPDGYRTVELDGSGSANGETLSKRLKQFEAAIPDANLRSRISEVAHQGSIAPTSVELKMNQLQDHIGFKGKDTHYVVTYDPATDQAHVQFDAKTTLLDLDKDAADIPNMETTAQRTFWIHESNELEENANPYVIDKSAPFTLSISTIKDLN